MTEKIRVLVVEPNKEPRVEFIENTLEAKQAIVGGYIEMLRPFVHNDDVVIICNEEGKLLGLEKNKVVRLPDGTLFDIIVGTAILVRAPIDSDDFASLTDEQIEKWSALAEW